MEETEVAGTNIDETMRHLTMSQPQRDEPVEAEGR
jgi:hypothetical protein